jgi:hypothetical protein
MFIATNRFGYSYIAIRNVFWMLLVQLVLLGDPTGGIGRPPDAAEVSMGLLGRPMEDLGKAVLGRGYGTGEGGCPASVDLAWQDLPVGGLGRAHGHFRDRGCASNSSCVLCGTGSFHLAGFRAPPTPQAQ